MKKGRVVLIFLTIILIMMTLGGCSAKEALRKKLLGENEVAVNWVSQYPKGQFTAQPDDASIKIKEKDGYFCGQMELDNGLVTYLLALDGNRVGLYQILQKESDRVNSYAERDAILRGRGEIDAKGRFILHIEHDYAHLFEGRLEKIIFLKEDAVQEEGS